MTLRRTLAISTSLFCFSVACGGTLDFGDAPSGGAPADTSVDPSGPFSPGDVDPNATLEPGWTWLNPRPNGVDYRGISGTAKDDIWLGDTKGGIWHFDGRNLSKSHQGSPNEIFYALWASATNDVWAASERELLHFDGKQWSGAYGGGCEIHTFWGSATNDVWAACTGGLLVRFDGTNWAYGAELKSRVEPVDPFFGPEALTIRDLWGASKNDVWAVADKGEMAHFDGTKWTVMPKSGDARFPVIDGEVSALAEENDYIGIWGTGPNDIWALAQTKMRGRARFAHFDGQSWRVTHDIGADGSGEPFRNPSPLRRGKRLWGTSTNDILAVTGISNVLYFDGQAWTRRVALDRMLYTSFWGKPGTALYGVAYGGEIAMHEPGVDVSNYAQSHPEDYRGPWTPLFPALRDQLRMVVATNDGEVFARGRAVYRWNGASWSAIPAAKIGDCEANDPRLISGVTSKALWVSGFVHCNGQRITPTRPILQRYDGENWHEVDMPPARLAPSSLWAASDDEIWLGSEQAVHHFDHGRWTSYRLTEGALAGIVGTARDDVWIVSVGGTRDHFTWTLSHFDGRSLHVLGKTERTLHPSGRPYAPKRGEIWLGGRPGATFNGKTWGKLPFATDHAITSMGRIHGGHIAVADRRVLYFDGQMTHDLGLPTDGHIFDVANHPNGALWLTGNLGTTLRYVPPRATGPSSR